MRHSATWVVSTLAMSMGMFGGCGPSAPRAEQWRDMPAPQASPAVPAQRKQPIDAALRQLAVAEIRAAAASTDSRVRINAVEAAQNGLGKSARDIFAAGLSDREPGVRFAAVMSAGKLEIADLHDPILAIADDPEPLVRVGVRYALHRLKDYRFSHDLEKTAVDPDPRVREQTAFVLGMLGETSALKILRAMVDDKDELVRIQVADSMWRLGDRDGLDILVSGTVSQAPDIQMLCLMGLFGPKDSRVAPHVRGQLTAAYPEVALVAARALGELGDEGGYPIAMKSIRSGDWRQRFLAATALGAIGRSDAQSALAPLLKDSEPTVRLAAAAALLQLRNPA